MSGNATKCTEMQGNVKKCKKCKKCKEMLKMYWNALKCLEMYGNVRKCVEMAGNAREYEKCQKLQGDVGKCHVLRVGHTQKWTFLYISKYLLTLYKICKMQMLAALLTDVRNLFTSIILIALEYGACRSGIKLDLYFYCPPKGSWPKECSEVTVSLGWRLICCKDLQVLRCRWCDGLVFIKYEIFMAFQMRDFEACGNVEYYVLPPV